MTAPVLTRRGRRLATAAYTAVLVGAVAVGYWLPVTLAWSWWR